MDTLLTILTVCILNSGIDYAGYNLTKHDPEMLQAYRIGQATMVVGSAAWLSYRYDLKTGGKFILLQWTFTNDILYYAWAWAINPSSKSRFEGRDAVRANLGRGSPIPHARWTLMAPWGDGWRTPAGVAGQSLMAIAITIHF